MTILKAKDLTLAQVTQLLGFVKLPNAPFTQLTQPLALSPLSSFEREELDQIRHDFDSYLSEGKVSEDLIQALTTFPLLRLAGFYRAPIQLDIERDIADLTIEDEDTRLTARLDLLALNRARPIAPETADIFFWVLVIESKNSSVAPAAGLPQLLTYAYPSLNRQPSVWGLLANGELYQFVYLQQSESPTYQFMPILSLMEEEPAEQLLQVLKAIRQQALSASD